MFTDRRISTPARFVAAAVCALAWFSFARGVAQDAGVSPAPLKVAEDTSLVERQGAVRDRLQRLENAMIKLSGLLAEREPEKAERLRDALQYTGSRRLKTRLQELTKLLNAGQFSEAEVRQEELLADLDALLTMLTSSRNELERRREERRRLEELKRDISALLDDQTRLLQDTRQIGEADLQAGAHSDELRRLEQKQRELQQRAEQAGRRMNKGEEADQTPGAAQIGQAAEQMREAADELGDSRAEQAAGDQLAALQQLQQALDVLDDVLRQVRREESEETLAALEARLRGLLGREKRVFETVRGLGAKDMTDWTRVDRLHLSDAAALQEDCQTDCGAVLRLVVDEGTTVIVPVLLQQLHEDMADSAERLLRQDVSVNTRRLLKDIITLLEELLDAVERKREEDAKLEQQGDQSEGDCQPPLLPGSAELKLLKSSQVRLNERSLDLMGRRETPIEVLERAAGRMSERQRRLADLARRMNERMRQ